MIVECLVHDVLPFERAQPGAKQPSGCLRPKVIAGPVDQHDIAAHSVWCKHDPLGIAVDEPAPADGHWRYGVADPLREARATGRHCLRQQFLQKFIVAFRDQMYKWERIEAGQAESNIPVRRNDGSRMRFSKTLPRMEVHGDVGLKEGSIFLDLVDLL